MNSFDTPGGLADDTAVYRFLRSAPIVPVTISEWSTGNILHVNDVAAALFGLPIDELLGRSMREFYADSAGRDRFLEALADNKGVARMELELRRADGDRIWVAASGGRVRYHGQDAIIAVINDITLQKAREADLAEASRKLSAQAADMTRLTAELRLKKHAAEAANAAKSSFLAHMSHELRSPLNAILGFAEIVRDMHFGADTVERYQQYGGHIHEAGTHLLALIDDILDLAKVEAGKLELQPLAFDLAELLEECAQMMRPQAERRGLSLHLTLHASQFVITADRRRVKQMVVNLLSNAIKFTQSGGRVDLEAMRAPEGGLAVLISDSGVGMTPDQILLALQPFGRVRGSVTIDPTGSGLGLPIVRNLIEAHGGKLEIVSEPDKGTVARLLFPADLG
jgi:two-component system cell cycle sensor histidine kinase PleC